MTIISPTTKQSTQDTSSTSIKMSTTSDYNMLCLEAPRGLLQIINNDETEKKPWRSPTRSDGYRRWPTTSNRPSKTYAS